MIIVTGGAGFIGSNLIAGLNRLGHEDILVVDNLSTAAKHLNLNRLAFSDYLDKEDLLDALDSLVEVEAIFHQGACSSTTETDGRYMMRNNYRYSRRLLDFALDRSVPFLYASSASVYGSGADGFAERPACEYPLNVYAFSKFSFDNHVRRVLPTARSQVLGLRYFNVYGPQENHKGAMASVAFHLFGQLQRGEEMTLFEGSDGFLRDFVHVDDAVAVNLHFLGSGVSGIYNCGTGQARSFEDVGRAMQTLAGRGELRTVPFPEHLVGKYQAYTRADLTALRAAGYAQPMTSLEDGLERYHEVLAATGGFLR
jgi:ADP-L-glycero-D-manno-heptose 6-epimerase